VSTKIKLPDGMPRAVRHLPRNSAGYPVPFFVEWVDGVPDFRIMSSKNLRRAIAEKLCWMCGETLHRDPQTRQRAGTFVAGPMCLINRNSAEPPCHEECAAWAARACPFLTNPNKERRHANLPEGWTEAPGEAIMRNPGVTGLIRCTAWSPYQHGPGVLFRMTHISDVEWTCQGREATAAEVFGSIESGLPALIDVATEEGDDALVALADMTAIAMSYVGDPAPGLYPTIAAVLDAA
jgi:hypothetical protein